MQCHLLLISCLAYYFTQKIQVVCPSDVGPSLNCMAVQPREVPSSYSTVTALFNETDQVLKILDNILNESSYVKMLFVALIVYKEYRTVESNDLHL